MREMKELILVVTAIIMLTVTRTTRGVSLADKQKTRLIILPHAYESNKIRAALDEAFSLSCITESDQAAANSLRWFSPQNEPIDLLTSTSLDNSVKRVYTVLKKNQLSVTFDKLVPQDAGIYTCRAVQDGQAVEIKVELVLEKKISFFETPLSQFIRGGQDQLVVCKATSIPGPEISWYRKGIYIELKNDQKYQITNDGLIIKNAQPEDEGVYYCKATVTATGEVKRAEIDVQVMSEPRWIIKPEDTDGVMDQDVVIRCEAFGKPAPSYKWLRDGIQLVGSRYQVTGNSLRIVGLTRYDAGTYTCWAENTSGWKDANFHLNVLVGPVVPLIEDVRVVEGNKAVLRCVVKEAFPKATIRWRITDQIEFIDPIKQPEFTIVDDSQPDQQQSMSVKVSPLEGNTIGSWSELTIDRATRLHRRNFTCVATNKAAVTERQMQLFVDYKPTLLLNLESREIYYSWIFTDGFGNSGSDSSLPSRSYPVVLTCLADGEPRPQMTWYHKTLPIHHDNIKYRLLRDEPGLSKLEVTPKSMEDFGDYMCNAENRHGFEQRNLQLRMATPPKFPPYFFLKTIHPDMVTFDIKPSDAPDADGGMPIESYRIGWRFLTSDWTEEMEKEVQIDPNAITVLAERNYNMDNVEVTGLLPDTEYLFRVCAVNKPGRGAWSTKEMKVKTAPRRQPDPVRVTSREDCQASTRCFLEWVVDSSGGSPVRDFLIRFRRISYKDSTYQHVNTEKIEPWSPTTIVKAPLTSYELINLLPDSFYEVEILARNDIGPSASQPFRVRTLPGQLGEAEEYRRKDIFKINRVVIISGLIIGALILYLILELVLLMNSNRGLLAYIWRSCSKSGKSKAASIEYKNKTSQTKIAQHQPKTTTVNGSKTPYQPIKQVDETNNVTVPINE